jgi:drug/metabolite transporter (DMT)-like permease
MLEGRGRGWALAAAGMLLVSTDSYFVRLADTDPWTVALVVSAFSLLVQLTLQRCIEGGRPVERFRAFPKGLLAVAVLSACSQLLFIGALTHTEVANVVVIVAASPVLAAVIGQLFFRERTDRRVWIAILITLIGVVVVVSASIGSPNLTGDLLAVGAITAFATNMNIWRRFPQQSRFVGLAMAAAVTIAISVPFAEPFQQESRVYLACAGMGVLFNPLGRLCHSSAPRHAPAAEVALFTPVETVAASAWAWLFFSEQPPVQTFMGAAVILVGLAFGTLARQEASSRLGT